MIDKKEIALGHHGNVIPIQVNPTYIKFFCLYLKYLEAIVRPIIVEIQIKTRLKKPLRKSIGSNRILISLDFIIK